MVKIPTMKSVKMWGHTFFLIKVKTIYVKKVVLKVFSLPNLQRIPDKLLQFTRYELNVRCPCLVNDGILALIFLNLEGLVSLWAMYSLCKAACLKQYYSNFNFVHKYFVIYFVTCIISHTNTSIKTSGSSSLNTCIGTDALFFHL